MDQSGKNNPSYTHGHTIGKFSPEYHSWSSMIQRCTNPKRKAYKYYGGRGIAIHLDWFRFENFLLDMGPRPEGTTLERCHNGHGYGPLNCVWADDTTQARNSDQVVWVEVDGVSKRLVEWCEDLRISINTVRDRVKRHGLSYPESIQVTLLRKRKERQDEQPQD